MLGRETGAETLSGAEINRDIFRAIPEASLRGKDVLIVCEDYTRATPVYLFFPEFLRKLRGMDARVRVLFALGTHRPMKRSEMLDKLGISDIVAGDMPLENHSATDEALLTPIGDIGGTTLKIHSAVESANTVITMGSVLPHRVVGFSGGAKMLCPGIGNKACIDYTHWISTQYAEDEIIGSADNPVREILNRQADMVEQKYPDKNFFCMSAVTTDSGIVHVYTDSFRRSFQQAAARSKEIFVKEVEPPETILALVDDKSADFWQAAKAVYNCARVLKDGGTIVVRGKMKEGISSVYAQDIAECGYSNTETIDKLYRAGAIRNQLVASHLMRVSEHLKRVRIVLCSEYISRELCGRLGLGYMDPAALDASSFDLVVHHAVDVLLKKRI